MSNQFTTAARFLISTLSNMALVLFILRILLQWARSDFYNPISQLVFRATNPVVAPLQRALPRSRVIDLPCAIVLAALTAATNFMLMRLVGASVPPGEFIYYVFARIVHLGILVYVIAIIVDVVLSWIGQRGMHPMSRAISTLTSPILNFFRRIIPPLGGLDFAPLVAILVLQTASILLPLPALFR